MIGELLPGSVVIDLRSAQKPGYRERGVGRYTCDLAAALVEHHPGLVRQAIIDPALAAPARSEQLVGWVEVSGLPVRGLGGILHVASPFELDASVARLWPRQASRQGLALVVTVYDLIPDIMADVYLADPGLRRRYRVRREMVRAADQVLAISPSAAADVVERLHLPEDRVTVVGCAPSGSWCLPADRAEAAAEAGRAVAGLGARYVLYPGAVEPRKNMERLVEAYAQLPAAVRAGWQLVLVCRLDPLQRNHFEVMARRLGIDGRLVLTGFVPDPLLRLLYQGADLVAFPSLYEGYGLPVVEAHACGAPVVASASSSLVELVAPVATFDPYDVRAIGEAVLAGLTDDGRRAELLAWAARPLPQWSEVAGRVAGAYELVLARSAYRVTPAGGGGDDAVPAAAAATAPTTGPTTPTGRRSHTGWPSRPRMAMVTPWPPAATGIAGYSARIVDALSARFDVDVFVDGIDHSSSVVAGESTADALAVAGRDRLLSGLSSARRPEAALLPSMDRAVGGYDAVLLCLGNSPYHAGALRLLRKCTPARPTVVAHEPRLTGLYRHGAARGAVPEGFEVAVEAMYPGMTANEAVGEGAGREVLMLREVARLAGRLLVTSPHAGELARLDVDPADAGRVEVWPWAYPEVVERSPAAVDDDLVSTFGIVNPVKQPALLLDAFAALASSRPGLRLAYVGPVSDADRAALSARAADLGVTDRVTITGWVTDDDYERWLATTAVAVQLRQSSNGETSAAVADCLARGIATIVSAVGAARDLPEVVVKVAPGVSAAGLAAEVGGLLDQPRRRAELATTSRRFVAAHSAAAAVDALLELMPELGGLHVELA